jgi:hypothetical protein
VTVSGNSMINAPADAIDIEGGGVVSGNYISGGGYNTWGKMSGNSVSVGTRPRAWVSS